MSPCSSCVRYSLQRYIRVDSYVCAGARAPGARASTEPSSPLINIVLCVLRDSALAVAPLNGRGLLLISCASIGVARHDSRHAVGRAASSIAKRTRAPTCAPRRGRPTEYVRTSISSHLMRRIPQTHGPSATVSRNPTMPAPNKPDANVKSSHSCTLAVPVLGSWLVRFLPESKVTDVIS